MSGGMRFASTSQRLQWTVPMVNLGEGGGSGQDVPSVPSSDSHLLVCAGCGAIVDGATTLGFECPNASKMPGVDHVLTVGVRL